MCGYWTEREVEREIEGEREMERDIARERERKRCNYVYCVVTCRSTGAGTESHSL